MKNKQSPFVLSLVASALLVGCNGAESDAKLEKQPQDVIPVNQVSGVALDGYLKGAKVCLDLNQNLSCDSGDGDFALTDSQGRYTLPVAEPENKDVAVIVEAIPYQTVDMDAPKQAIEKAFVLSAPMEESAVISPFSTMISVIASQQNLSFDQARSQVSQILKVDESALASDYVAGNTQQAKQLHVLGQAVTRLIQQGEAVSAENGVSRLDAREGVRAKLAIVDLVKLKEKTDTFVGRGDVASLVAQSAEEHLEEVKVSPDEFIENTFSIIPPAPKQGKVDDVADTFDWEWVGAFRSHEFYESSKDFGKTWQAVSEKPLNVGMKAYAKGAVQVRIRADEDGNIQAGKAVISEQAFTEAVIPSAPGALVVDDAQNEFSWQDVPGYSLASEYEYSIDNGETWQPVTAKPQRIDDIDVPAGKLQLRVAKKQDLAVLAGQIQSSTQPFTVTPAQPQAPVNITVDDQNDTLTWQLLDRFPNASDYEVYLRGQWQSVEKLPLMLGNEDFPERTIKIRVIGNSTNGMKPGYEAIVEPAFTKEQDKPVAPTSGKVNDAQNTFDWDYVRGFEEYEYYEISVNGAQGPWSPVVGKPAAISDDNFAAGSVCVRVRTDAVGHHPFGDSICSGNAFTETPATPVAPTNPVVNDAQDTFGWTAVAGFPDADDYQIKVSGGEWKTATQHPYPLEDRAYAPGEIKVRVKQDDITGRQAGAVLENDKAFTVRPPQPDAPQSILVDDGANTFDWDFVSGFDDKSDYEYSLTHGQEGTWAPVIEKPINVGNNNYDAGQIQLRVKANTQNGMPASEPVANSKPFFAGVQVDAPINPRITNKNIGDKYNEVKTNGFQWDWVTDSKSGVRFGEASDYEYTNDGGTSWHQVTSNPQHVGPKAYDKSLVGVRVKANIQGQDNAVGKTLWAMGATTGFVSIQYVAMKNWQSPAGLASYSGKWLENETKCYAVYQSNGEGLPTFWAKLGATSNESEVESKLSQTVCGLNGWQLPTKDIVDVISQNKKEVTTEHLIGDSTFYWTRHYDGTEWKLSRVRKGQPYSDQWLSSSIVAQWVMPELDLLTAELLKEKSALELHSNDVDAERNKPSDEIGRLLLESERAVGQELQDLITEVAALQQQIIAARDAVNKVITDHQPTLERYELYRQLLNSASNGDVKQQQVLENIESLHQAMATLQQEQSTLEQLMKVQPVLETYVSILTKGSEIALKKKSLNSLVNGDEIYQVARELYVLIDGLKAPMKGLDAQLVEMASAINILAVGGDTGLIDSLSRFQQRLQTAQGDYDIAAMEENAKQGLEQAKANGHNVNQADAIVGTHFAKLDINGNYLTADTTYEQGWRCVEDIRQPEKKQVWTLLKDGLPGGEDDLHYDLKGTDEFSVVGDNSVLDVINKQAYCGYNDWKLPFTSQFDSLNTVKIDGIGDTIDISVFPHHRAMESRYDKYSGGKSFYYWTSQNDPYREGNLTYIFSSDRNDNDFDYASVRNGSYAVVLARFVRDDNISLLKADGTRTYNRDEAICARIVEKNETWQLFDNNNPSERFKLLSQVESERDDWNLYNNGSGMCGINNWRLPSEEEIKSLRSHINFDDVLKMAIKYNGVEDINNGIKATNCYVTTEGYSYEGDMLRICYGMKEGNLSAVGEGNKHVYQSLYRFVAK